MALSVDKFRLVDMMLSQTASANVFLSVQQTCPHVNMRAAILRGGNGSAMTLCV